MPDISVWRIDPEIYEKLRSLDGHLAAIDGAHSFTIATQNEKDFDGRGRGRGR